jgi:hypothetical protein
VAYARIVRVLVDQPLELAAERIGQPAAAAPVGIQEQGADRVRELRRRAVCAFRRALTGTDGMQELGRRATRSCGPGRRDVQRTVIVRATGQGDARVVGLDPVSFRELLEVGGGGRSGNAAGQQVRLARPGAVSALPDPEQEEQSFDVRRRERRAHPVERVRERVRERALAQEPDEVDDRCPPGLQVR